MAEKFDRVDLSILKELRDNAKQPLKELAKKLDIHHNTLMQRLKKLEKTGVIKSYSAEIDYTELGYGLKAIVTIKVRRNLTSGTELLKEIAEMPEILCLYAVTGNDDCVASVVARDREDLVRILRNIQKQKYVVKTNTYLVLITYKDGYQANPIGALIDNFKKEEKEKK
ncbi:Lrp/AsnC family transcriptional regulator [Candidatus Micrarchaeota archaeon]|nr:Lrp/AsnC family transcriptional regulator [Candidatus Micrarchaeota archaeon]